MQLALSEAMREVAVRPALSEAMREVTVRIALSKVMRGDLVQKLCMTGCRPGKECKS